MSATTHVSRWGASLAVRIPKAIAQQMGVQEGSEIEITPETTRSYCARGSSCSAICWPR